ncbi:MAG TPA: glycoside hydrolase family 97 N-terminal domain-containing protein [Verrucomicrobiae bacterium]|nr:glycoside hydrolase family 97 N-terminal domain-containing protein [Verrucomicrobiae bacterium]
MKLFSSKNFEWVGRHSLFLFAFLVIQSSVSAAVVTTSPDGNIVATVDAANGKWVYSIAYRGVDVIEASPLGATVNGLDLSSGISIINAASYSTNQTFVSRHGIHEIGTNHFNANRIFVNQSPSGRSYAVNIRVFNNGVAFRYEFSGEDSKSVSAESTSFVIPAGATVWSQSGISVYENIYLGTNILALATNANMGPPVTIQLSGTNGFLALTESAPGIFGNPYLVKTAGTTGRQLQVRYPMNVSGNTGAIATGDVNALWNVIMVGADLDMLVNNDIVESLAPAPDPLLFPEGESPDWITTGRSVWDWLRPQSGGITAANAMTNSLWASRLGFEYNTVDDGWQNWNGGNPWPQIQDVVEFSHALGVKVLVWKRSLELASASQRTAFLKQLQSCGVDGFKADFFDFNSINAGAAERLKLQNDILREAAFYHLVANFHGSSKPAGQFRTFPNLLNVEAVFGKEQWPNAWMVLSVPFTRFLAGPADFTPMEFGANKAFEIAHVINMPGPMITFAERSDTIAKSPFASLIRAIPPMWDETRILSASALGQTVASVRRNGGEWFVGVMNNGATQSWTLPLDFLDAGTIHRADVINESSTKLERLMVSKNSSLSVTITNLGGSGFVARIYREPGFAIAGNYRLLGTVIGTTGAFGGSDKTRDKVFDNNLTTYFDAPIGDGAWAGLDLGAANQKIVTMIRYCPRPNWPNRMVGGEFQGANSPDFSDAVSLAVVGYSPPEGNFTTVTLTNRQLFRYVRYLSPPGGWGNVAEVQFYGGATPTAPNGLTALGGANEIVLNWNSSGADSVYNVKRSTTSGGPYTIIATNFSGNSFTNVALDNGVAYYFVVTAVNPVGLESGNSSEVNAVAMGAPAAPQHLRVISGTDHNAALSWNAVPSATIYHVKRSLIRGGAYDEIAGVPGTNFTDVALKNGLDYYYVVSAENSEGESENSAEVSTRAAEFNSWMHSLNPVGYWRLDEISGIVAKDSSGNGLNGMYQSDVTLRVPGISNPPFYGVDETNRAVRLDGSIHSWISLPPLNLNSATVTFTAWIYPSSSKQSDAAGLIFCRDGAGTTSGFGFNPTGTQLSYTWNNDSGTYGWNSGLTPPADQWSFVALVVTPTNATIYLSNQSGQNFATVAHAHEPSAFEGETRIGNDAYNASRMFEGRITEVGIFNQALTSEMISVLYQSATGFYYDFALTPFRHGNEWRLAWPDGAQLLEAEDLSGPWKTNFATAPFFMNTTGASKFFRIEPR